jgi:hypothetical protein
MHQGKFVLSQLMEFLPRYQFSKCVEKYQGHYRTRKLSCYDQFLSLAFGQLSHRESLRDIVNCLSSQKRFLHHLGFSGEISRSTLADANEKRSWKIYRDFAQVLIGEAKRIYCDDKEFDLHLDGACYLIDSSIIELCLNMFPWAKMKTVRAAVKLNMQLNLKGNLPHFFDLGSARKHDLEFLDIIDIESGAYYVMDRGYVDFKRLYKIHDSGAFFIIRGKEDLGWRRLYSNKVDKSSGVCCDQVIVLTHWLSSKKYPEKLRRVKYFDQETNRHFVYLTNDFNISAETVAALYKYRWQVELFFKWIKQHLKIKDFWGYSENAVKTQICIAICTYLIVSIARKKLGIERNLYEILQILNVTLLTKNPINTLLSETELQIPNDCSQKQACLLDF